MDPGSLVGLRRARPNLGLGPFHVGGRTPGHGNYVGVIFGLDPRYSFEGHTWNGFPDASFDTVVRQSKERFVDLVKNSYRVLLSPELKGYYVHFMGKETEMSVKSRIES